MCVRGNMLAYECGLYALLETQNNLDYHISLLVKVVAVTCDFRPFQDLVVKDVEYYLIFSYC